MCEVVAEARALLDAEGRSYTLNEVMLLAIDLLIQAVIRDLKAIRHLIALRPRGALDG